MNIIRVHKPKMFNMVHVRDAYPVPYRKLYRGLRRVLNEETTYSHKQKR